MNIFKLTEKLSRRMKWYDFGMFKLGMVFVILFLVTVWDGFRELVMSGNPYFYLIVALVLFIPLWKKVFKIKNTPGVFNFE